MFAEVLGYPISKDDQKTAYFLYLGFLFLSGVASVYATFRKQLNRHASNSSNEKNDSSQSRSTIRNFISGGFSLIVDWTLERNDITFLDIFSKPKHWETFPIEHKESPIVRLVHRGESLEIRFPKNKPRKILVRKTLLNSDQYGDFSEDSIWNWKFLLLLVPFGFIFQLV